MTDTAPEITELVRQKLMARSGEERFLMGVFSFETAREMVLTSLPVGLAPEELKRQLFQRLYGQPMPNYSGHRTNKSSVRSEIFVESESK